MRRVTPDVVLCAQLVNISIHTLHAEGDAQFHNIYLRRPISIHTLHAEGDRNTSASTAFTLIFLSTPSMRRVTKFPKLVDAHKVISIHTLHAEGDKPFCDKSLTYDISIHTLHAEGDDFFRVW